MQIIENQTFDQERALYGSRDLLVRRCAFDGPADGESALKESRNIEVEDSFFNLRYPFWHDHNLVLRDVEMTELCRAALWYSQGVRVERGRLHGIKALRECADVRLQDCDIVSPEFGWSVRNLEMRSCSVTGEYAFLRARDLRFEKLRLQGKYSFQYIEHAVFEDCELDTKDAFWHAKNVLVRNCTIRGEYLAWYCENVTFENCRLSGTQPLCYCKGLRLIDCEMLDADLAFEKSEVDADLTAPIRSIKNPASGCIRVPAVGEILRDDEASRAEILVRGA